MFKAPSTYLGGAGGYSSSLAPGANIGSRSNSRSPCGRDCIEKLRRAYRQIDENLLQRAAGPYIGSNPDYSLLWGCTSASASADIGPAAGAMRTRSEKDLSLTSETSLRREDTSLGLGGVARLTRVDTPMAASTSRTSAVLFALFKSGSCPIG